MMQRSYGPNTSWRHSQVIRDEAEEANGLEHDRPLGHYKNFSFSSQGQPENKMF